MQNLKEKIVDKALLIVELPFYPIVYFFLKTLLKTKEGRARIYLRTKRYVPLRRLLFYVLDKLFLKASESYSKPSYSGIAGYILDLKYAIAHSSFNKMIFSVNYSYTLSHIEKLIKENGRRKVLIIDFGCGAGVLTRALASKFKGAQVVGLDIREETMNHNNILYSHIEWDLVSTLDYRLINSRNNHIILVCNGVINFMQENELNTLLSKKIESITWFYYTPFSDLEKEYKMNKNVLSLESNDIHYNVPFILRNHGYSFMYNLVPSPMNKGNFVHGVSKFLQ